MNILSLGTAERRLFAIYEPPARADGRPRAALLCYPWGTEYIYAHRTMRHLATQLTACGYHALRFDYFGTGDSGGEPTDVDLSSLESDAGSAVEALRDISAVPRIALIGLRVGANVAARVAGRQLEEVQALVLWDPILCGREYVQALAATEPGGTQPLRIMRDLNEIDLGELWGTLPERSLVLITDRHESDEELHRLAAAAGETVTIEVLPAPCPWLESATTTGVLPVPALRRIIEWLR